MEQSKRQYFLTIENYHIGPNDVKRTQFYVRGETAEEVLDDIIYNTQPSFSEKPELFRKSARLFIRREGCIGRNSISGDEVIPTGIEHLYLRFFQWTDDAQHA